MLPQNKSYKEFKFTRKPLKCSQAVFNKYGKEISIHDYIQAGKDGTIAKEIIQKAGGFDVIKGQMEKFKCEDAKITIDLNTDLFEVNRKLKMGKIAEKKFKEKMEIQKKLDSIKQKQEKNETKGGDNE